MATTQYKQPQKSETPKTAGYPVQAPTKAKTQMRGVGAARKGTKTRGLVGAE